MKTWFRIEQRKPPNKGWEKLHCEQTLEAAQAHIEWCKKQENSLLLKELDYRIRRREADGWKIYPNRTEGGADVEGLERIHDVGQAAR